MCFREVCFKNGELQNRNVRSLSQHLMPDDDERLPTHHTCIYETTAYPALPALRGLGSALHTGISKEPSRPL